MKKLGRGQLAIGAGTTVYTVPTGYRTEVLDINIANTNSTTVTCAIHLVPAGSSASNATALFPTVTVPANTVIQWTGIEMLNAGDFIQGIAGTATSITVNVTGNEYRAGT